MKQKKKKKTGNATSFHNNEKKTWFPSKISQFCEKRKERLITKSLVSRKRSIFLSIIRNNGVEKQILIEDPSRQRGSWRIGEFRWIFRTVFWSRLAHDREKRKEKKSGACVGFHHHVATLVCFWRTPNQQRLSPLRTNYGFTNLWQASLGRPCARHFPCPRASPPRVVSLLPPLSLPRPGQVVFSPLFHIQFSHLGQLIFVNFFFFFCSIFYLESEDSRFKIFSLFNDYSKSQFWIVDFISALYLTSSIINI